MRTKHGANKLAESLNRADIEAAAIHGNKSQGARTKALAGFKDGSIRVLVATDIAARGLDISRLPHVVNYELPNVPEDYVHRIGRTGRAGEDGAAISLVARDEEKLLRDIQRVLKRNIPLLDVPVFEPKVLGPAPKKPPRQPSRKPHGGRNAQSRHRGGNQGGGESGAGSRKRRPRRRPEQASGEAR